VSDLKLRENESRLHYIWRVYQYQEDTNTISNDEAGEICRKGLKENYDESSYRKVYQSWQNMWLEVKDEYISEEALLERLAEIDEREDDLYRTKVKTADKLREYRAMLRHQARFDNIQDTAINCASMLCKEYPFINDVQVKELSDEKLGVLLLSDFHYGLVVDNFLNKYNTAICKKRLDKVVVDTIETCKLNGVDDLKIVNLSDLISGYIHVGLRVENEEDVITQIMEVSELMANAINQLAPYFNSIIYIDTLDNHSRISIDKKLSIESENLGRIIPFYLKSRLAGLNNVFVTEERFDDTLTKFDILGETCFAVHGHHDKINSIVSKITLLTRVIPMAIYMAHIHHHYEKDEMGIDLIVNGSLSGADTYAKEMRLNSKPMQKLLVYEKRDNCVNRSLTKHIYF